LISNARLKQGNYLRYEQEYASPEQTDDSDTRRRAEKSLKSDESRLRPVFRRLDLLSGITENMANRKHQPARNQ
jgi:hypothetical protein